MKILAVDTSTEQCSVALLVDGAVFERCQRTARDHAELVLRMVETVLQQGSLSLDRLDGIAFGRGPGGFTGVRIGVGVAQGLAFGAQRPVIGISDLAAVAKQAAVAAGEVLVCMDARMGEVYWGVFYVSATGAVESRSAERVGPPSSVQVERIPDLAVGTGFAAYPELRERFKDISTNADVFPRALEVALLAESGFAAGQGLAPRDAQPSYVRNEVVTKPARNT